MGESQLSSFYLEDTVARHRCWLVGWLAASEKALLGRTMVVVVVSAHPQCDGSQLA